jgi:sigma-E factor negative regulatory protein RseB
LAVTDSFQWRYLFLVPALVALTLTAARADAEACAAADADALAWLDKMSRSLQQVSYHGIVTFQRGDEIQAMQISHFIEDGVANERLTELTGHGAEVVRVDHPLDCVHPGNQLLQLGAALQAGDCGVAQYYRFGVVDGELVAGRRAVRIRIEPRDMYRYGYVLELDQDTGLLLKSATIGRGNKILESFQFASLSYSGEATAGDGANVVHQAQHPQPGAGVLSLGGAHPAWTVNWLPQGFTATDQPADVSMRRTFTDGLAVFSIFLEILSQDITPGEGVVRRGGTISYTRGMHMSGLPVLVTVIGEVPLNTARMVADSVAALP